MNILVTGGAGFIASNIVDAYIKLGHKVVVIDDLSTGRKSNLNKAVVFLEMDIRDSKLESVFKEHKIEFVNHQAARGDVRASIERPMEYADVNVVGGINILECCRKNNVKGIIYSSSGGCVYGEPQYVPTTEEHPMQPRDPYGASKACYEIYLQTYRQLYGINYTIFRYPNVYGPRQNPFGEAGVVSIFAKKMITGQDIIINGDGEQIRDYVFIDDVVKGNLLATERTDNTIYNLGTGVGTSVNAIFDKLRKILDYNKMPVHGPAKSGEVSRSLLSYDKIKMARGWTPAVSFDEGLAKTVNYVRTDL